MEQKYQDILERKWKFKVVGTYGVRYLDDFLLGIHDEDFVLIGSASGMGKTEMAYNMAFTNAKKGLNVHLFALEADMDEPFKRRLYRKVSQMYYDDLYNGRVDSCIEMSYRDYATNQNNLKAYEQKAMEEINNESYTLTVHYRETEFNVGTLIQKVKEIENNCDLLILDHVDYFDFFMGENEHAQMTRIMKTLRDINQVYRIPMVVLSHMRKKQYNKQLLYSIEDFMGTSNKAKQAKTVIIMSRDAEGDDYTKGEFGTFISIPKTRVGVAPNLVCRAKFLSRLSEYKDEYILAKISGFGEAVVDLEAVNYPSWAGRTKRKERENERILSSV